jgi:hypothetical protein
MNNETQFMFNTAGRTQENKSSAYYDKEQLSSHLGILTKGNLYHLHGLIVRSFVS